MLSAWKDQRGRLRLERNFVASLRDGRVLALTDFQRTHLLEGVIGGSVRLSNREEREQALTVLLGPDASPAELAQLGKTRFQHYYRTGEILRSLLTMCTPHQAAVLYHHAFRQGVDTYLRALDDEVIRAQLVRHRELYCRFVGDAQKYAEIYLAIEDLPEAQREIFEALLSENYGATQELEELLEIARKV